MAAGFRYCPGRNAAAARLWPPCAGSHPATLDHRHDVRRDHRRRPVRHRHGSGARLRQPAAGPVGHRQSARPRQRAYSDRHRTGGPERHPFAGAPTAVGPVDRAGRSAQPATAAAFGNRTCTRPGHDWTGVVSGAAPPAAPPADCGRRSRRRRRRTRLVSDRGDSGALVRSRCGAERDIHRPLDRHPDGADRPPGRAADLRHRPCSRRLCGIALSHPAGRRIRDSDFQ